MAKYYNNMIKTGKVAGSVFSVRGGEVIERAYNPIVANPSTPAQIEARAKLKLMSQLAADMADIIAFRRVGNVSGRNQFVKANYPLASFSEGQADIPLASVDLTGGRLAAGIIVTDGANNRATVSMNTARDVDRMLEFQFEVANGKLKLTQANVSNENSDGLFQLEVATDATKERVFYVYGVRFNNEAARTKYGNIDVTPVALARLLTTSTLLESDVTLTATAAKVMPAA